MDIVLMFDILVKQQNDTVVIWLYVQNSIQDKSKHSTKCYGVAMNDTSKSG